MNDSNYRKEAQEYFQKAIEESKSLSPKEALLLLMERLFDWGDFEYDNIFDSEKALHEPILTEIDKRLVQIKKNKELISEITFEFTKEIKEYKDLHYDYDKSFPDTWYYSAGDINLFYLDVIEKIGGLKMALPNLIGELEWIEANCHPFAEDGILVGVAGDESVLIVGERILKVIAQLKPKETIPLLIELVKNNLYFLDKDAVRTLGEIGGTKAIIWLLLAKHNLFFNEYYFFDADLELDIQKPYDPDLKTVAEEALSKLKIKEETLSDKLFWELFNTYKEFEFHTWRGDFGVFYDGALSANHFRFAWAFKINILENLSKFKNMIEEGIEHVSIRLLALDFLYVVLERQDFTDYLIDFYPDNSKYFEHIIEALFLEVGIFDAVPILLEQGKELVIFNMIKKYQEKIFDHFKQNENISATLKEISNKYE